VKLLYLVLRQVAIRFEPVGAFTAAGVEAFELACGVSAETKPSSPCQTLGHVCGVPGDDGIEFAAGRHSRERGISHQRQELFALK
jgi:hypothetical protein